MKKALIAASTAIILAAGAVTCWTVYGWGEDDLFNENLEALMDKSHTDGTCLEEENACLGYCPGCGKLVEAMGNHKGPAGVIHHCQ